MLHLLKEFDCLLKIQCAHVRAVNKMADIMTFQRGRKKQLSLSVLAVSCFKKVVFQALDGDECSYVGVFILHSAPSKKYKSTGKYRNSCNIVNITRHIYLSP